VPRLRVAARGEAPVRAEHAAGRRPGLSQRRGWLLLGWRVRLPELGDLAPRLARVLAGREPLRVVRDGARRAAVAVVVSEDVGPAFVFIRRQARADDPWSGQMAFPGGFQASEREPLETTAVREALEETGLDLAIRARLLGALDDLSPRTPYLPPLIVAPYVFAVPSRVSLIPGEEADEALWIPAREIFDPTNQASYTLSLPGGTHDFPAIQVEDHLVWGLTERILRQVADLAGI
jgi:8-oxo-dGTP pyrophosphatase MutT (NUDIX family)